MNYVKYVLTDRADCGKRLLLLKSETNTETEMNFRILQIYYFFGIKNVRVGGKFFRVGRKHIFFGPNINLCYLIK